MLDFIIWVAIVGSAMCMLVFLALIVVVMMSIVDAYKRRMESHAVLPPPDKAADRTYGLKYFYRANGKYDGNT